MSTPGTNNRIVGFERFVMIKNLITLLFVLTALCAPSYAQTMINQSSISNFPYNITTSGSYKLSSNITVSSTGVTAFLINAPNVTLDLNGYTISGPLVCTNTSCNSYASSFAVSSSQPGTTVQNGFIKGFLTGVYVNSLGHISNLTISSCEVGIQASQSTVHHNTISNCYSVGIYSLSGEATDNIVTLCQYGIYALSSSIMNNTLLSNSTYGLMLQNGVFFGNTILNNATDISVTGVAVTTKNNACTSGAC